MQFVVIYLNQKLEKIEAVWVKGVEVLDDDTVKLYFDGGETSELKKWWVFNIYLEK